MAKVRIDTKNIEGFDKLSAEEKLNALLEFEFEDNSEELATTKQALDRQKKATDKASSDAADFKRQLREKMTADEQAEADRVAALEKLKAENEAFRKESRLAQYKTAALGMGFSDELATKRANALYEGDFNAMAEIDKAFLEAHDKELNSKLFANTPTPPVGGQGVSNTITAEQFKKMGYRELVDLKENQPDLYNQLAQEINQ